MWIIASGCHGQGTLSGIHYATLLVTHFSLRNTACDAFLPYEEHASGGVQLNEGGGGVHLY